MKRTPLKRGRRRTLTAEEREQMIAFKRSTWGQPCAVCGRPWDLTAQSHHVVYEQHLDARDRWRLANALPLCAVDHEAHHNASRRVPFRKLTAGNVAFAYHVLGNYASDYLKRYPMDETEEQT